jgi:hypothetical protein
LRPSLRKNIRHELSDDRVILNRGDNRSSLIPGPRGAMEKRMAPDQGQQRTEISPLPNGKRENAIGKLLCKRDNDVPFAAGEPALQSVPAVIIDLDGAN